MRILTVDTVILLPKVFGHLHYYTVFPLLSRYWLDSKTHHEKGKPRRGQRVIILFMYKFTLYEPPPHYYQPSVDCITLSQTIIYTVDLYNGGAE